MWTLKTVNQSTVFDSYYHSSRFDMSQKVAKMKPKTWEKGAVTIQCSFFSLLLKKLSTS
jgi:hypothetical protein